MIISNKIKSIHVFQCGAWPGRADSQPALIACQGQTPAQTLTRRFHQLARQPDKKRGADPLSALHGDPALMFFDNFAHNIQPQPTAFANRFGGEKRVKNLLTNRIGNAATRIADRNHRFVIDLAQVDGEGAVIFHRLQGIVDQIGPDLI